VTLRPGTYIQEVEPCCQLNTALRAEETEPFLQTKGKENRRLIFQKWNTNGTSKTCRKSQVKSRHLYNVLIVICTHRSRIDESRNTYAAFLNHISASGQCAGVFVAC
jgi:hypothetical protein